jgi:hypothetical protein
MPSGAPVGLWLPEHLLEDTAETAAVLGGVLGAAQTPLLGLNAFPAGDFHADCVKDAVYQPAWDDPARLTYTLRAAEALAALSRPGAEVGITTVPVGWPRHDVDLDAAGTMLERACSELELLSQRFDCTLFLAIEPEPRCLIPTATALAEFVSSGPLQDAAARGTLRACLDACHLAVEHEPPSTAVTALGHAGIRIGRVQVSSAPEATTRDGIEVMQALAEPKWMHQTSVLMESGLHTFDDLPDTVDLAKAGLWRTHLHVPVHRTRFGALGSTQAWIALLLAAVADTNQRPPVEVETYAWNVLPAAFRLPTVQAEIARELEWTQGVMQEVGW